MQRSESFAELWIDETWTFLGHIHMSMQKVVSLWQMAFGPITCCRCLTYSLTHFWTAIHGSAFREKRQNFKPFRFSISCRVSISGPPHIWWWMTIHSHKMGFFIFYFLPTKCGNWIIFQKLLQWTEFVFRRAWKGFYLIQSQPLCQVICVCKHKISFLFNLISVLWLKDALVNCLTNTINMF